MTLDAIRYDLLVQDALRNVVRKVLGDAARDGMPGDHHFYITFRTDAAGVRLSPRMRERYPDDMTIVLQHQFWDLHVSDYALEVGLSFNNIPEQLLIPFDAITGFFDPSVQFGLKFDVQDLEPDESANDSAPPADDQTSTVASLKHKTGTAAEPATQTSSQTSSTAAKAPSAPDEDTASSTDAKVISIDAFRKKT
jgi:hypothetical protein